MEDEADQLRRHSRAHTTIDSSLAPSAALTFSPPAPTLNPAFRFPVNGKANGKARAKGGTGVVITDTSVPLPDGETPQIVRNKRLREGAMAGLGKGRAPAPSGETTPGGSHRRKSSIGRGKRISSAFESTGIISELIFSVLLRGLDCLSQWA